MHVETPAGTNDGDTFIPNERFPSGTATAKLAEAATETKVVDPKVTDAPATVTEEAAKVDETTVVDAEVDVDAPPPDKETAKQAYAARKAQRKAQEAEAKLAEIEAKLASLSDPKQAETTTEASKKPNPADYALKRWDAQYEEDLEKWNLEREQTIVQRAIEEARKATEDIRRESESIRENTSIQSRVEEIERKGVDKYADFDEIVTDAFEAMPTSPEALKELVNLPNAEDVLYHLAQNPDVLEKITAKSPMGQALEFGKIATRIANSKAVVAKQTKAQPSPTSPKGASPKVLTDRDEAYTKMLKATQSR